MVMKKLMTICLLLSGCFPPTNAGKPYHDLVHRVGARYNHKCRIDTVYHQKQAREREIRKLAKVAVRVLHIPFDEAVKRTRRVSDMSELQDLGTPDTREYQTAVDIIMQIPSNESVTIESMKRVVDEQIKTKHP